MSEPTQFATHLRKCFQETKLLPVRRRDKYTADLDNYYQRLKARFDEPAAVPEFGFEYQLNGLESPAALEADITAGHGVVSLTPKALDELGSLEVDVTKLPTYTLTIVKQFDGLLDVRVRRGESDLFTDHLVNIHTLLERIASDVAAVVAEIMGEAAS